MAARIRLWYRGSNPMDWWLWALAPVLVAAVLLVEVPAFVDAWEARSRDGRLGMFTAESDDCAYETLLQRGPCFWTGTFVSDDGLVRRSGVQYSAHELDGKGDQMPARDVGDPSRVFRPDGGHIWIVHLAVIASALGFLAYWSWHVSTALRDVGGPDPATGQPST